MSDAVALVLVSVVFFFNGPATTEIYTLSLHDALPIWWRGPPPRGRGSGPCRGAPARPWRRPCPRSAPDRKSTRLNSSHTVISYAVFCLKKKTKRSTSYTTPHNIRPREIRQALLLLCRA